MQHSQRPALHGFEEFFSPYNAEGSTTQIPFVLVFGLWWSVMSEDEHLSDDNPSSPRTDGPPPVLLSIRDNPVLDDCIREFLEQGYPSLDRFFGELQQYHEEIPTEANVLLFPILGGFFYHLHNNVLNHDLDIITATGASINSVMGDPVVASQVQRLMEGAVAGMVVRKVNG